MDQRGGVEGMGGPILTGKFGQFDLANVGEQLIQPDPAIVVFDQDAAGQRACPGMDLEKPPEVVDDKPGHLGIPVNAPDGDTRPAHRALDRFLQHRGKRPVLEQRLRVLRSVGHGSQERLLVRRGRVEADQHVARQAIGLDVPDPRKPAHAPFDLPLTVPGPAREMDADATR